MSTPASGTGPEPDHEAGLGLERVVFFTDAVFAISITLLVLELRVPQLAEDATNADLGSALVALAPKVFTYLLSFGVVGLYWLAHWRRFAPIHRVDEGLVRLNLVLLAFIALIPFPTAVLGEYGDKAWTVVLYSVVIALAGVAGTASWLYAHRHGLMQHTHGDRWVRLNAMRGLVVPIVFLGTLPLVLINPYVAEVSWLLVFPLQAWFTRLLRREP